MKCKQCRQPGSPINNLVARLDGVKSVSVLSACAGYDYEGHHNLPEHPYILFTVKDLRTLENLRQKIMSRLSIPVYITFNGANQFLFEISLPKDWPKRDEMLVSTWAEIDSRLKGFE
jgi:hypothetical protein